MLYQIYCLLTETYVCNRIHNGGQYAFYFRDDNVSNKERCQYVCAKKKTTKGEHWTDKKSVEKLLTRLNNKVPGAFEIHSWSLREC